jgi:tetrahydromethanopterin S-methyltransferase subunit G
MSKDIEQLKKQLDQMEKKIDGLNIDKIWQVYESLRNPIKAVSKMFKK